MKKNVAITALVIALVIPASSTAVVPAAKICNDLGTVKVCMTAKKICTTIRVGGVSITKCRKRRA